MSNLWSGTGGDTTTEGVGTRTTATVSEDYENGNIFNINDTISSTTPRANNTALGASNRVAVTSTRGVENPMFPTLTVAICRSSDNVGRIIPVRRMRSSSSLSTLSHSSYGALSSSRGGSSAHGSSSIRSTTASGRTKPYFVKDRENPGIAHFCKDIKE